MNPNLAQSWARATLAFTETRGGITIGGIRLAASPADRSQFAQMLVLLREAEDLLPDEPTKQAFRQAPQTITDAHGNPHTMTIASLRALLVAYGQAYQTLWSAAHTPPG